jgi:flagellin-like protein
MIEKYTNKFDNSGVSPVIGVILLVAVTVALVALATVIVFDLGGDVSEPADATTDVSFENGLAKATVVRNSNVDEFILRNTDTGTEGRITDVGQTAEVGVNEGDNVVVIAVVDGNEEVLSSNTVRDAGVYLASSNLGIDSGSSSDDGANVTANTGYYKLSVNGVESDDIAVKSEYTVVDSGSSGAQVCEADNASDASSPPEPTECYSEVINPITNESDGDKSYVGFVVDNQDSSGYTYEITATLIDTTNNAEGNSFSWTFTANNGS